MDKTAYWKCGKCGAHIPVDNISAKCHKDEGVLFVHYDPVYTSVVLINTESGVKHTVNLSSQETSPKPTSRQIAGIIGPY